MSPADAKVRPRITIEQLEEMFNHGGHRCAMITELIVGFGRMRIKRVWKCKRKARATVQIICPQHGISRAAVCAKHLGALRSGRGELTCLRCDQPAVWSPT
jgi:hypothetical protein